MSDLVNVTKDNDPLVLPIILGTAGHIDHGKSSVVRNLSGIDPDRLPEEQQRKLTIDLGFASWTLPDGRHVGIVDVPGHERFIKNMVAGATSIDVVMLIVAADDGVMPQTLEHLDILNYLGVQKGIVVITKIDLVDEELVEVVELELQELLQHTFLESAPICSVSSVTGAGFENLKQTLQTLFNSIPTKTHTGPFRLPIQRVFSAPGFGTVCTGIPISGSVKIGDTVELLPQQTPARVRSIHAYKQPRSQAVAGHSSALNVPDLSKTKPIRGNYLCTPGLFQTTTLIEVRLHLRKNFPRALKTRSQVRFHCGTAELIGDIYLLEDKFLEPDQSMLAQIRLQEPTVVVPGDPFVLRLHSPLELLGGGRVIGTSKHRLKSGKPFIIERLKAKEAALDDIEQTLLLLLSEERFNAYSVTELAPRLAITEAVATQTLDNLAQNKKIIAVSGKGRPRYLATQAAREAVDLAISKLKNFYTQDNMKIFMPISALAKELKVEIETLKFLLSKDSRTSVHKDFGVTIAGRKIKLSKLDQEYFDAIGVLYESQQFTSPTCEDAISSLKARFKNRKKTRAQRLFDLAVESEILVRLAERVVLHKSAFDKAKAAIDELLDNNGEFSVGELRDKLETSRKYLIPLLEYFDSVGYTERRDNVRVRKPVTE